MMKKYSYILVSLLALVLISCGKPEVPKPYGYYRLNLPDTAYCQYDYNHVCQFLISQNAITTVREDSNWVNIVYPQLRAQIHCSYKPVSHNLRELIDDSAEFAYKHAGMASAISESEYMNPEQRVFGVFYTLKGNTASPYQFFLTDSTEHFLRASVYFDCLPNQDSLQPAIDYIHTDVIALIESLKWK